MSSKETLRFFRGHVQRPFVFGASHQTYSAFELSFPCPSGLSGGPLFLARESEAVIGVVTAKLESYTIRDAEEIVPASSMKFAEW